MEEESDWGIGERFAKHLWHQHQVIIVNPDWKTREYSKKKKDESHVYVLMSPSR